MNNLILAIIATVFAASLMFAGVSYLNTGSAVRTQLVAQDVADIQQMVTDYENLKINLGHSPTGSDYAAVYANQQSSATGTSQNAHYSYTSGPGYVLATKVVAVSGAASMGQNVPAGWTYLPASLQVQTNGLFCKDTNGNAIDCFCMKVTRKDASADIAYQAAKATAEKEMQVVNRSEISFNLAGCGGTGNAIDTNPATWPKQTPDTYYLTFGSGL